MQLPFWRRRPKANDSAYRMPIWKRYVLYFLVLAVIAVGMFIMAGGLLVRDDTAQGAAEVAVILMGDLIPRTELAESLLKKNLARKILFFRPIDSAMNSAGLTENEGDLTLKYLLKRGVKRENIEYITNTHNSSTREESKELVHWAKRQSPRPKNLAICTGWYHTSRAGWILEKEFSGQGISVRMHPAVGKESRPSAWWRTEQGFLEVFTEYLKWAYYLARY